jgi:hypothetical protein
MPIGSTRQNFQDVVNQRDRAFARIQELEMALEEAQARAQRAERRGAPEASEDASLGEYFRAKYAGRFNGPEALKDAVDNVLGSQAIDVQPGEAMTPERIAAWRRGQLGI